MSWAGATSKAHGDTGRADGWQRHHPHGNVSWQLGNQHACRGEKHCVTAATAAFGELHVMSEAPHVALRNRAGRPRAGLRPSGTPTVLGRRYALQGLLAAYLFAPSLLSPVHAQTDSEGLRNRRSTCFKERRPIGRTLSTRWSEVDAPIQHQYSFWLCALRRASTTPGWSMRCES